jgi:N-hydroxyarylamine O-acetyltransferase
MIMSDEHLENDVVPAFERSAYLARIGYEGSLDPTPLSLNALHFAHVSSIPFENLDIVLGRSISLDLGDLQTKLVTSRRGGYCFEQNALFAAVLESLGFNVRRLAARVRFGTAQIRPRLHMLLEVEVDGEPYLADVGFGCSGPLWPLALNEVGVQQQGSWAFRVNREGDSIVLQSHELDDWLDLYAFTRELQDPVDYEPGNHWTSTHPDSPFVRGIVVQKGTPISRLILRDRELTEVTPDQSTSEILHDDQALLDVLANRFGLAFPKETRFPIRG